jgi:hypothetical protein
MRSPAFSSKVPVGVGVTKYELMITNAGSPDAFTADQSVAEELTVMPNSSASIREEVLKPPRLVSKVDRLHWQAAGGRPFASPTDHGGASRKQMLPAGTWSFTPQGHTTFKQALALPATPRMLTGQLERLLGATGKATPPASLSLSQYGFLLAAAPLTSTTRKALLSAMGELPGIHLCGALFPHAHLHDEAFCVNGDPTSTGVLLDPRTGVASVVSQRLNKPDLLYPNMPAGALVDSATFSLQPATSS